MRHSGGALRLHNDTGVAVTLLQSLAWSCSCTIFYSTQISGVTVDEHETFPWRDARATCQKEMCQQIAHLKTGGGKKKGLFKESGPEQDRATEQQSVAENVGRAARLSGLNRVLNGSSCMTLS